MSNSLKPQIPGKDAADRAGSVAGFALRLFGGACLLFVMYMGITLNAGSFGTSKLFQLALVGGVGAISIGVSFFGKEIRIGACIWLVAIAAFLFAADYYFSQPKFANPIVQIQKQAGVDADSRGPLQVLLDEREAHPTTSLNMYNRQFLDRPLQVGDTGVVPLRGVANARVIACNEPGHYIFYETDPQGFFNPPETWNGHDNIDLMLVGDSFTVGVCHDPGERLPDLFRQRFPSMVNLAQSDIGPLIEMALIREYVPRFQPDTVLWIFYENDFSNLTMEMKSDILQRYLADPAYKQNTLENAAAIDAALRAHQDRQVQQLLDLKKMPLRHLRQKIGALFLNNAGTESIQSADGTEVRAEELLASILRIAARDIADQGGQMVFVYLQGFEPLEDPNINAVREAHRQTALAAARAAGLPVIDTTPAIQAHFKDPAEAHMFARFGHYTREAYDVVFKTIISELDALAAQGAIHPVGRK